MNTQLVSLYCPKCSIHTDHSHIVNSYATVCVRCGHQTSQLERNHMEAASYMTPDGHEGKVVENTDDKVVFWVEEGEHRGYYVYDKHTGFGAVQHRPLK